ncbi:type II CAAX endopeptidase family protein [Micromonospora sp. WMMD1082]|uniref:CPBP family intramembrane glutamic endopeptidase n=1 Tax=Micromonospora sp. WMMD1082 TaxID=3016104 RepID=UPI002417A84E|nr:type II CAAX endopeptidase family protein [Micromonospora sp. WMMD1082]MDG4795186.1 type II CAAX endopeptidase family protein [Micromonospora sp. WMMD1082]
MRVHAPPAGTAYHRITQRIPWWRTLLTLIAVLISTQVAVYPARLLRQHLPLDLPILGGFTPLIMSFLATASILPVALLIVRWGEARRVGTLCSVTGRLRWPWLLLCTGIAVVCAGAAMLAIIAPTALAVADGRLDLQVVLPILAVPDDLAARLIIIGPILLLPIIGQAAAEEFVTRGAVLQAVGRITRSPWPAIAVQAAVFTALHGSKVGFHPRTVQMLCFGLALGWITVRTGGIEAACAFHTAFNVLDVLAWDLLGMRTIVTGPWTRPVIIGTAIAVYVLIVRVVARGQVLTTTPAATSAAPTTPATQRGEDETAGSPT